MSNLDIAFKIDSKGFYDIDLTDNGDLLSTQGLDTAILMSIFCEKRANEDEIPRPEYRRGDWSNELNEISDYEVGSKLWLLDQARTSQSSLDDAIEYIREGLQWLIDDGYILDVDITGELTTRQATFTITLTKLNNTTETKVFEYFKNTRYI